MKHYNFTTSRKNDNIPLKNKSQNGNNKLINNMKVEMAPVRPNDRDF